MKQYKVVHPLDIGLFSVPDAKDIRALEEFLNKQSRDGWDYKDAIVFDGSAQFIILEKSTVTRILEKATEAKSSR